MMCLVRLKNINILLLAVLLLWYCMCAVCGATEKTYTITESQLTQVQTLNQSLTNANQLFTQYENNQQINKEKNYAIGLGIGNNGIAIAGDIKNTWIIADEKTVILGYKFKF